MSVGEREEEEREERGKKTGKTEKTVFKGGGRGGEEERMFSR